MSKKNNGFTLVELIIVIVIVAIIIGVTGFSLIDKARKNHDINVVSRISTTA